MSLVIVDINPEFLTRVLPLALHEVVIRRRIVGVGGRHRGHHPAVTSTAPVKGGVAHGVGAGRRLGTAASLQTVLAIAGPGILLLTTSSPRIFLVAGLAASRGRVVMTSRVSSVTSRVAPASHLGVLGLKSVIAVIMVRGRGVVVTRGRAHRPTVILPLTLTKQLLLKHQQLYFSLTFLPTIFLWETF